jgi:MarR family transcriptional regulator, transcriptional regulator for hemolysin
MAPNDPPHPARPADRLQNSAAQGNFEQIPAGSDVGRAFGFLVHDVSRLIKRRFERRARKMGLAITRQQAAVILNIAGKEGVSQAEVATWLGIEPIALVRMLDKLHDEGLVERRAHPTDRRVRTLWLTPAARPVVERILTINEAIRREAFSGLPPRTCDVLIDVLSQIKDKLALKEEVACDRSNDGSHEEGSSASGN